MGQVVPWLQTHSRSAISRVLHRLDVVLRRARDHVHSPDPAYPAKQADIAACVAAAWHPAARSVTLFLDEVTIHRQPTIAPAYAACGGDAPHAERSLGGDVLTRVLAALDAATGRVSWVRQTRITVATLVGHSKGNLVIADALHALQREDRARSEALCERLRIVCFSARVKMPRACTHVTEVIGRWDMVVDFAARREAPPAVVPDAWHHTNTDLFGAIAVTKILKDLWGEPAAPVAPAPPSAP